MSNNLDRLKSIFAEALAIVSHDEREAFVVSACADDATLAENVRALLVAHDQASEFLEPPVKADGPDMSAIEETIDADERLIDSAGMPTEKYRNSNADSLNVKPGMVIGRYKLLQQIGEGGFGVVYMAEQEVPVKRRVALKIIKAGMDTKQVIARFEAERQALAMMDHPNIARVLDAGATDSGRPYFVMELVKGIPITDYCDEANLDTRHRLDLFKDVCAAVQHAHQKGIIHRDLKPSNIMITLRDDKPNVKVIDFGIAKATEQKLTEKTLFTSYGQMIGTPAYMSPEQAVMSEFDVDTRSDVYSLGVLLYELLTGGPPFDAKTLRTAGFDEMRRIIREQEPPKPSTRLSTMAADLRLSVAAKRHVSPAALSKQLHGDLDWIVMKALEKDRSRRYESASAFAQDIERHLEALPVNAAAPSAAYRFRKFARRNKGPITVAAAIAILLLAGTIVSTWQAVRATQAKGEALAALVEKEKAIAAKDQAILAKQQAVVDAIAAQNQAQLENQKAQKRLVQIEKANDILGSIFRNLDPRKIARAEKPLQAILVENLDEAVAQLDGDAIGDPLMVATMQGRIGISLLALGEPAKAVMLLEKARNTFRDKLGAEHTDTLAAMFHLGKAYLAAGKINLALSLNEETLKMRKATLGANDPKSLASMVELADAYRASGKYDQAVPLFKDALKLRKEILGPEDPETLATMDNLAHVYAEAGNIDLALPLYEEALKLLEEKLGPEHLDTLATMSSLVDVYNMTRRYDEAVSLGEHALRILRNKLGPEHPSTLVCMNNIAIAYQSTGKLDEAIDLFEQVHNIYKIKFGPNHPQTFGSMNNLAAAYWRVKQFDKAIPLLEETLKLRIAKLGPNHPLTLETKINLGVNYKDTGRYKEAIPLLEEGFRAAEKLANLRYVVAPLLVAYAKGGEQDKFTSIFKMMEDQRRSSAPKDSLELAEAWNVLAGIALDAGVFTEAQRLLNEGLSIRERFNIDTWTTMHARVMLGAALLGQKKYAEAEQLLVAGYEGLKARANSIPARARPVFTDSIESLIELYTQTHKPDEVKKWQAELEKYREKITSK